MAFDGDVTHYGVDVASQVLINAAKLIEIGWTQGMSSCEKPDGTTAYCLAGAISESASCLIASGALDDKDPLKSYTAAMMRFVDSLPRPVEWSEIVRWNDAPERKKEDVLRALHHAAVFNKELCVAG